MSDLCHTGRRRALCTIATIPAAWFGKPTWAARTQSISSRQRLICIGSAVTEIVYALDANDLIVGVDTTSIYPDAARSLPSIGYSRTLSAEGVLSLSPSQILCTEDAGPPVVLQQIQDAGIRIERIPARHTFTGVCDRVIAIGQSIHQQTRADQLKLQLQQQWARIEDAMKAKPFPSAAPRVLYIHSMNPSQVMVSGQETNANAMIRYAGLRNAMDGFRGYKPLTPEAVIMANPDLILVTPTKGCKRLADVVSLRVCQVWSERKRFLVRRLFQWMPFIYWGLVHECLRRSSLCIVKHELYSDEADCQSF